MSDPEVAVEIALFTKAREYTALPLVFENDGAKILRGAYVEVKHFRNGSIPYALAGDGDAMNIGMLQMLVCVPLGSGQVEPRQRGADIVKLFWTPANLSLSYGGLRVRVQKRPVLGTGVKRDTSYVVPVSIFYEVFI
jgi:hypothetical protein